MGALGARAVAGSGLGGLLAGCRDAGPAGAHDIAATFEVSQTGALISVHSSRACEAMVMLERELDGAAAMIGPVILSADTGYTEAIELDGLEPNTAYQYVVSFDGAITSTYRLRTAPPDDADTELIFLISADLDVSPLWDSPILDSMRQSNAAFYVNLGDWPYADNAPGAWTIPEYRARHLEARAAPKVQALLQSMPLFAIYDDHEARNNWDAHFRQTERERIENAMSVWHEWFPLRTPVAYRSWRWGRHAELFMLDTRLYRSANKNADGPDKTMLGTEQRRWLLDGLAASTASFKIIFTTVPLDFGLLDDHWASFAWERDFLLAEIANLGISGALFLSADQHWFGAHRHARGAREFQLGPLARGIFEPPPAVPGVLARSTVYNYGEVHIKPGNPPKLVFTCRDANGAELYTESFTPADLVLAPV